MLAKGDIQPQKISIFVTDILYHLISTCKFPIGSPAECNFPFRDFEMN